MHDPFETWREPVGAVQGRVHNVAIGIGNDDSVRIAVIHRYGDTDSLHIQLGYDAVAARELARLLNEAADAIE